MNRFNVESMEPAMRRLAVDPSGTHLVSGGAYHPLIIETAWSAFADPTEQEWRIYLATRRRQGFNAVLVTVPPVLHDRDQRPASREPWLLDDHGHHRFDHLDDTFFRTARAFTAIAHEHDIRLMITVLWNNYLPGTWGAAGTPHAVMPDHARQPYLTKLTETFADLEPIFVVGGDDHYTVPAANAAYLDAIAHLRAHAPGSLLTTHSAPNAVLPEDIAGALDFHLHQSGHNVENQELTWRQPARYLARTPRRPLLNSEPPYEGHGIVGGHGRWTREDVRRAIWTSVLAGATAGIGYGAHGTWMWHAPDGDFQARAASLPPYAWTEALALPGALDISLLARLMADHRAHRLLPAQHLCADDAGGSIRVAASPDLDVLALYLPYAIDVDVSADLTGHRITGWDLAERAPIVADVVVHSGHTRFRQGYGRYDQVYVAERAG
jgi:Protein of unknown function (DUF4038)